MAEVKVVVTSGKRGMVINRRDLRVMEMVSILIWVVGLHLYAYRKFFKAVQYL